MYICIHIYLCVRMYTYSIIFLKYRNVYFIIFIVLCLLYMYGFLGIDK